LGIRAVGAVPRAAVQAKIRLGFRGPLNVEDLPLWLLGDATVEGLKMNIHGTGAKDKAGRTTSESGQYDG